MIARENPGKDENGGKPVLMQRDDTRCGLLRGVRGGSAAYHMPKGEGGGFSRQCPDECPHVARCAVTDLDLFGGPVMRRSAFFPFPGIRRRVSRDWAPGPRAFVLGCNPSSAGEDKEDPTTLWLNAWFQLFGFGGYDIGNLYPFCTSSPVECRKRVDAAWQGEWHDRDQMQANTADVMRMAKAADQVFVCFGAIAWDWDWIEHVVEMIQTNEAPWPDLWCWGKTASGAPKHPMARGLHRIPRDQKPILWRPR